MFFLENASPISGSGVNLLLVSMVQSLWTQGKGKQLHKQSLSIGHDVGKNYGWGMMNRHRNTNLYLRPVQSTFFFCFPSLPPLLWSFSSLVLTFPLGAPSFSGTSLVCAQPRLPLQLSLTIVSKFLDHHLCLCVKFCHYFYYAWILIYLTFICPSYILPSLWSLAPITHLFKSSRFTLSSKRTHGIVQSIEASQKV